MLPWEAEHIHTLTGRYKSLCAKIADAGGTKHQRKERDALLWILKLARLPVNESHGSFQKIEPKEGDR